MKGTLTALTALFVLLGAPATTSAQHFPADDSLIANLRPLVEDGLAQGIVLGVLEPDGSRRIVSWGSAGAQARPLGSRSVFDIGSITKVFTATLLADMVAKGEVSLDDPASRYLPAGVRVPSRGGRQITLLDLATHRSALPRFPLNLTSPDVEYSVEQLYEFLADYELEHDVGARFDYSNLGFGLLGHVLAQAAGSTYVELLRQRILEPLGMHMSSFTPAGEAASWLVEGHDPRGNAVPRWYLTEAFAGGGGLNSNVEDMLNFLAANVSTGSGEPQSPLERAMQAAHRTRVDLEPDLGLGLAWQVSTRGGRSVLLHTGGSRGFRSFIGFDPVAKVGVVLLANSATDNSRLVQLGRDLIAPPVRQGK
jgi:serine-type D-Ala-D-Ala carboxypeptidase/endopeptidase